MPRKQIAQEYKEGKIQLDDIDEKVISNHLYTAGLNDPDLLIRTASEIESKQFSVCGKSLTANFM